MKKAIVLSSLITCISFASGFAQGQEAEAVQSFENQVTLVPVSVNITISGRVTRGAKYSFEEIANDEYRLVVKLESRTYRGVRRGHEATTRIRFGLAQGHFVRKGDIMYLVETKAGTSWISSTPFATYDWWIGWSLTSNVELTTSVERRAGGSFTRYTVTPHLVLR